MFETNLEDVIAVSAKIAKGENLGDSERGLAQEMTKSLHDVVKENRVYLLAQYIERVVNEAIYETPDALLEELFDFKTVDGDNMGGLTAQSPANTLQSYEANPGGNVPRSFVNLAKPASVTKILQIETDISFDDIKRNGWKSVAMLTDYATASFRNRMLADTFAQIDAGIASGDNFIAGSGAYASAEEMAELATFASQYDQGLIIARKKYVTNARMLPSTQYIKASESEYAGVPLRFDAPPQNSKGQFMLPDKRMFAIAGKLGALDLRDKIDAYSVMDYNKQHIHLLFKNFTYRYAFYDASFGNVAKLVLQ